MEFDLSAIKTGNTAELQRRLQERSLAMHAQSFQSQIKSKLLTQAIMQMEESKKNLKTLNNTLSTEIAERKLLEEQICYVANHDDLTGLPNRVLFRDRLETARSQAARNKKKLAILFVDLDGFKAVNDTYGHQAGDKLLQQVSVRLQATVRQSDTVARIGGDEFVVLLNNIDNIEDAEPVALKILESFKQAILVEGHSTKIGGSLGIAVYPDHSEDTEKLIAYADSAMYRIKKTGKNAYAFHQMH
jgi:diguanylate cyclase (GGDEF)-like protein